MEGNEPLVVANVEESRLIPGRYVQ
ncbi:MAG: hypothetical protein RMJ54_09580 [Roseiflexaceae bacterium]|nr:hypothetical protein [Roseiflexaceae bacterium]MDW8233020.1 hypothetical protein [Roseiflexaceae bacterium]